jgi:7-cyano-7-deazaguanine synthase in queuosine biosynthesis
MWSGGIDSTYVLAKQLLETNNNVFAHHIYLKNCEGRDVAEAWAVKSIGDKLSKIRPFTFTSNHIDDTRMPTLVYDMARTCFEAGAVSKAFYHSPMMIDIDKWTIGTHSDEGHNWERWEFIGPATKAAEWSPGRTKFMEFELPPMVTKREEMDFLAKHDLLDDCWYCRTPIKIIAEQTHISCGKCKTCVEVKKAKGEL